MKNDDGDGGGVDDDDVNGDDVNDADADDDDDDDDGGGGGGGGGRRRGDDDDDNDDDDDGCSLNNLSNEIRWSLDLRWQRPDKSVGFHDLKDGVLMRTKDQPDLKIDWDSFNKIERHEAMKNQLQTKVMEKFGFSLFKGVGWMGF